jgi:hypothetical protein
MSDSIEFASSAMQLIGGLYAVFIAVVILGIQTIPTIGSENSKNINKDFYNDVKEKIPTFQTLNLILAYFVLAVEFSYGAYIYYMSSPTKILFIYFISSRFTSYYLRYFNILQSN